MPHKSLFQDQEGNTCMIRKCIMMNIGRLKCIETYSVFATKVLYNEASESGATAHTRTPILVTPAENKINGR